MERLKAGGEGDNSALKFYSSVRLDVRRTGQIKDGEDVIGGRVKVKVVKNKVAPPFKKAEFDLMFGTGISKIGELIDLAVEMNIIRKSGSWFSYGENKIGQGRDAVIAMLNNNTDVATEIENKVREQLKGGAAPASDDDII